MTKRVWVWLVFLILSGALVTWRGGTVSYLLFYVCLLLPVAAGSYLLYVYFQFRVYQSIGSILVVKESAVPYQFALANEGMMAYHDIRVLFQDEYATSEDPVPVALVYGNEGGLPVSLLSGEKWTRDTVLRCHYRGKYQVGIDKVEVRDFLGLFRVTYHIPHPLLVRVMPRIVELTRFPLAKETQGKLEQRMRFVRPERMEPFVREYRKGDSMRQIHWKATARLGKLMSREMTEEPREEITVFLEPSVYPGSGRERLEAEDKLIEAALAVAAFYQKNRTAVRIYWNHTGRRKNGRESAYKTILIRDRRGLDEFYQVCCELDFDREPGSLAELVEYAAVTSLSAVTYLLTWHPLSPDKKNDRTAALSLLRRLGISPAVLSIGGSSLEKTEEVGSKTMMLRIAFGEDVKERLEQM